MRPLPTRPRDEAAPTPDLLLQYRSVRAHSIKLAAPLSAEDQTAQSMPDASPAKWHLAHITWFFETFVLSTKADYTPFDPRFGYLFNSYYETLGARQPRPYRGLLTRPAADEVLAYRRHVDAAMEELLSGPVSANVESLVNLGLAHEQQHQELLLTDILHLFAQNPLRPAYAQKPLEQRADAAPDEIAFLDIEGGLISIGRAVADQHDGFCFDNETPRHQVFLRPYRLADRLVNNAEWLAFMQDGGYARPELWLSDGWARVREEGWCAPLYWEETDGGWASMTLSGLRPIDPLEPVTHVSYYEADAYARWRGLRLPTEAEWEHAAAHAPADADSLNSALRPRSPDAARGGLRQLFSDCWQWTASPYSPYPGFEAAAGAVGEYNGKFMVNQMVLRGGSCATPPGHVRETYRNFFHPHQRWQFSGVRLAADAPKRVLFRPREASGFLADVLDGLSRTQKSLPSKYFYDEAGSALFEAICELEEYYPTRTEAALLAKIAPDLSAAIPKGAALIEFGSGSSVKTRLLLNAAPQLGFYAPIDISPDAVGPAAQALLKDYPALSVTPIVGDFTQAVILPPAIERAARIGFFPGSTIGNFSPADATTFLSTAKSVLGDGARFIVGVDLVKDPQVLVAAYDDAKGVTRAFNKNILVRINRELDANFDVSAFNHRAVWNGEEGRIEMHLASAVDQSVSISGRRFHFAAGETIHTENSYKYQPDRFSAVAEAAGWRVESVWISPPPSFAVFLLKS